MSQDVQVFILHEPVHAQALIAHLKANAGPQAKAGHPLQVTVAPYRRKRSVEQNSRYWKAVLEPVAQQARAGGKAYVTAMWNVFFKELLLPEKCAKGVDKWVYMTDGSRRLVMSTTDLNTKEMADYCDQVEAYAATEFGVVFHEKP